MAGQGWGYGNLCPYSILSYAVALTTVPYYFFTCCWIQKLGAIQKRIQIQLCLPGSGKFQAHFPISQVHYVHLLFSSNPRSDVPYELIPNTEQTQGSVAVVPVVLIMEDRVTVKPFDA